MNVRVCVCAREGKCVRLYAQMCICVCGCVGFGWTFLDGMGCWMDGWTFFLVCSESISAHFGVRAISGPCLKKIGPRETYICMVMTGCRNEIAPCPDLRLCTCFVHGMCLHACVRACVCVCVCACACAVRMYVWMYARMSE